ncbi:MAG: hypothetical protein ACOYN4_15400 [Bacteroidales bacterium]
METEIIKTSDPNVVIEAITTTREINLQSLLDAKKGYLLQIAEKQIKIAELQSLQLPPFAAEIIEKEIAAILGDVFSCQQQIGDIDTVLSQL